MSRQHSATKRARTEHQDGAGGAVNLPGREQLLLTSPELQTRLGLRFLDETELLPLLQAAGPRLGSASADDSNRGEASRRKQFQGHT
jgi:hypothetical protein